MAFLRAEVIGEPLKSVQERVSSRNLGRLLSAGIRAWGAVIDEEFAGGFWYMPGGGQKRWAPVKAFGNVPENPTPLQRSGRLRASYRAAAAGGGAITVTQDGATASFSVNVPGGYAAVHRGGSGKLLSGDIAPLAIQVTPKMRWFLGLVKGVWLKRSTSRIILVRRPHATSNPKIRGRLRYLAAQWAAGKPLPEYG